MYNENGNGKRYVPWAMFLWAASIIGVALAGVYGYANAANMKAENNSLDVRELQTQYKSIDRTLQEIKILIKER